MQCSEGTTFSVHIPSSTWTSLGILAGYYVESDIYEKLGVQVTPLGMQCSLDNQG